MTTLNTIIEEEKKAFAEKIDTICKQADLYQTKAGYPVNTPAKTLILSLFTTAIQRAYEAGQSEKQARIRESFYEWFKNNTEDVEDWAEREFGTIPHRELTP